MLKLKNVSKFYYSNGVVSSGFTKINLDFELGEFVAITGESGSGKSTLLNVISGLDTYEDGEMYINGEETSAYSNADFENYRRKYIANIYQSFNLINSYTVAQNVEMVLMLSGLKAKERKAKIKEVLERVGLYKFRNTKASKLSGGQKQRVAIARALVKDTPIIVADEPTGNLDSASAASIIQLLSELASDRLVIVVTHNYEQVEPYVTRKITMHDGRVTEDLVLRNRDIDITESQHIADDKNDDIELKTDKKKHLKFFPRLRLGFRNAFNIIPKFLLLLFIFIFICASVTSLYSNIRQSDYQTSTSGYNEYFNETSDRRIVIKKSDGSAISAEDFEKIEALANIDYIFKDDAFLDSYVTLESIEEESWYYFYGSLSSVKNEGLTEADLIYGRMPEADDEIILLVPDEYYILVDEEYANETLTYTYRLNLDSGESLSSKNLKIVGIAASTDSENWEETIVVTDAVFNDAKFAINASYSTITVNVAGQSYVSDEWSMMNKVIPCNLVGRGCAMVSSDWNYYWDTQWAPGHTFTVEVKNLYYTDTKTFSITDLYYKQNFTDRTGYSDYEYNNGIILVNQEDYNEFFAKDNYQSSVFIKDIKEVRNTISELEALGYETLYMQDALQSYGGEWTAVEKIYTTLWSSFLVIVLFFVSYFIIKLIFKSRNVYYATIRMLGATAADCRSLIVNELLLILNIAFVISMFAIYAAFLGYYQLDFVNTILEYLVLKDYIVLYGVLTLMSLFISLRYSRQLFKSSAMNVYKEV